MLNRVRNWISSHKSLVESFFSLTLLNGVVLLFPLLTLPHILRVVGPANYGIYGFIYILIQYVLIFNNYGFDFSATKEISQNRGNLQVVNRIFNAVLACRLLLFALTTGVFYALSPLIMPTSVQRWMFLGGLTLILGNTLTPVWLFQGMEKMRYLTIVNVLGKTLFLALVFVVICEPGDYVFLPLLDGLGYLVAGMASMWIARKQFGMRWGWPSWGDIWQQMRSGAAVFGSTLGMTLYRKSNIFILEFIVGKEALGIYTAAEKIITGFQGIISPISQALFPHLGRSFKERPLRENLLSLVKVSRFMVPLLTVGVIAVIFLSDFLIALLCGPEFSAAKPLLRVMSPVLLLGGMNYILGIVGLVNLDRSKTFFSAVLLAGVVSVSWVLIMAPRIGVLAGAWAMTLAEGVLFVSCLVGLMGLWRKSFPKR